MATALGGALMLALAGFDPVVAQGASRQPQAMAASADEAAVRAFITAQFSPTAGADPVANPRAIFEPKLAAALEAIRDSGNNEAMMFWGADPICNCQDADNLSARITTMTLDGDSATARLMISNFGEEQLRVWKLVRTPAGWRIHSFDDDFREEALIVAARL